MNRRPSGLKISKALVGFLHYKAAERLSPSTLTNYEAHLKLWISQVSELEIDQVTAIAAALYEWISSRDLGVGEGQEQGAV